MEVWSIRTKRKKLLGELSCKLSLARTDNSQSAVEGIFDKCTIITLDKNARLDVAEQVVSVSSLR
jgi:hypothetical protein